MKIITLKSIRYVGGVICTLLMSFHSWADEHSASTEIGVRPPLEVFYRTNPDVIVRAWGYNDTWNCPNVVPVEYTGKASKYLIVKASPGQVASLAYTWVDMDCTRYEYRAGAGGQAGRVCAEYGKVTKKSTDHYTVPQSGVLALVVSRTRDFNPLAKMTSGVLSVGGQSINVMGLRTVVSQHALAAHDSVNCPSGVNSGGAGNTGVRMSDIFTREEWNSLHDYSY